MDMKEPLVSVLMCVYNTPEAYLREALDSIVRQSYANIQLVIVDDGSDHADTLQMLWMYADQDRRIQIITNVANVGLTKSLNIGLEQCRGDYVARMDADDISYPDRLEKQVEYMETHPDVSLVGANIAIFSDDITKAIPSSHKARYQSQEIYNISLLFDHFGPAHPTFMFRRGFLDENHIKYREDILKAQDYAIKVDIRKANGTIKTMPEVLLYYRQHDDQITAKNWGEQEKYRRKISKEYLQWCFPELTDNESNALMTISCSQYIVDVKEYIVAIRKILFFNKTLKKFDVDIFDREMKYQWIDKVYCVMKVCNDKRGFFRIFTIISIPAFLKVRNGI